MLRHVPNILSASRIFLALLFFSEETTIRVLAIFLAGMTDFLDGFLARRLDLQSSWGTTLDPIGDKIFVTAGLGFFFFEGAIPLEGALLMLSRDFAILIFALFLLMKGRIRNYPIKALFFGKITTALQLGTFLLLAFEITPPSSIYLAFGLLGLLALFELCYTYAFSLKMTKI